jgi:ornithine cyclodeaminase/alanine dehydrogenase-like protein (mu-crystallin family)
MDGTWITAMRTGAVAAISINLLQNKKTQSYSFIGLGNMARAVLLCLNSIFNEKSIEVKILKYKNQHNEFIARFSSYKNITFKIYNTTSELISSSEVIISCVTVKRTNFADDIIYPDGILVVPVHTMGFQNCDLFFDKIYCDDIDHINGFKYFKQYKNCDEISNILLGKNKGRTSKDERIIVYNIGISLHDIYFASKIYDLLRGHMLNDKPDILLQPIDIPRYWV